jgi:hypothetical protein
MRSPAISGPKNQDADDDDVDCSSSSCYSYNHQHVSVYHYEDDDDVNIPSAAAVNASAVQAPTVKYNSRSKQQQLSECGLQTRPTTKTVAKASVDALVAHV